MTESEFHNYALEVMAYDWTSSKGFDGQQKQTIISENKDMHNWYVQVCTDGLNDQFFYTSGSHHVGNLCHIHWIQMWCLPDCKLHHSVKFDSYTSNLYVIFSCNVIIL